MNDDARLAHFDLKAQEDETLSQAERRRIAETIKCVPADWQTILDVGCGDGRVAEALAERGKEVVGLDWSEKSIKHFKGKRIVCDIRGEWKDVPLFDGTICCEVLEHLTEVEARKVVDNLRSHGRKGFFVTVPAKEPRFQNTVICSHCKTEYHPWGHLQQFDSFEDVDRFVGQKSIERNFIEYPGLRPSQTIVRLLRSLGFSPYSRSYVCPHCGKPLTEPNPPGASAQILAKGLGLVHKVTSPLREPYGWFVCLYR
jgi:SAM-dependent methyltransferase